MLAAFAAPSRGSRTKPASPYRVLATGDLTGPWSPDTITETLISDDAAAQIIKATATPPAGATRHFIRLEIGKVAP